ncbi:MAG TPA: Asp-tRNA(Asn)/Glu-tRNA(Gln) amidotransferase subunit GatC [Tepidisphaeraceae bacterium]|nr:Asp-tRNA(Asn)/Glu-tRNA(Gln) amidotransferase subunit GatC [Tepidisphaeraceae bacterium]
MPESHITLEQVRHVAKLARLAIPEDRLADFTAKIESILTYVEQLKEVDVEGIEPTSHAIPMTNVLREDVVRPAMSVEDVLKNAPESDGAFFKVPKVIGGDEDSAG